MKAFLAAATTAVLVTVVPSLSQAQDTSGSSPIYGSLGYSQGGYEGPDLGAIQGRLGARVNKYVGGEAEIAVGVKDDHTTVAGARVDAELKHQAAIYGVGFLPVNPKTDVYARLGYGNTKVKASVPGAAATAEGDSINYGVGAQHVIDGKNGLRADYTRHDFRHDRGEVDSWSVGYVRKF